MEDYHVHSQNSLADFESSQDWFIVQEGHPTTDNSRYVVLRCRSTTIEMRRVWQFQRILFDINAESQERVYSWSQDRMGDTMEDLARFISEHKVSTNGVIEDWRIT